MEHRLKNTAIADASLTSRIAWLGMWTEGLSFLTRFPDTLPRVLIYPLFLPPFKVNIICGASLEIGHWDDSVKQTNQQTNILQLKRKKKKGK